MRAPLFVFSQFLWAANDLSHLATCSQRLWSDWGGGGGKFVNSCVINDTVRSLDDVLVKSRAPLLVAGLPSET